MTEQKHINFERYKEFVDAVTSDASKDYYSFAQRLDPHLTMKE